MDDYLKQLTDIITNGAMDNTYKMSWIRSIVETCEKEPKKIIHFDELSSLIFKYYWNQSIFFNLQQGPNLKKKPKIQQLVEEKIKEYKDSYLRIIKSLEKNKETNFKSGSGLLFPKL